MTDKMPDRIYIDGFRKIHQCKVGTWYNEAHEDGSIEFIRTDIVQDLVKALEGLIKREIETAESGDCGFYDGEEVPEVISALAALKQFRGE